MASRKKSTYFNEESTLELVNEEEQNLFDNFNTSQAEEIEKKIDLTEETAPSIESPIIQVQDAESSIIPPVKYIRNQRNIPRFSRLRNKDL